MLVLGPGSGGSSLSQIIQVYETGWQSLKLTINYLLLPEISDIK